MGLWAFIGGSIWPESSFLAVFAAPDSGPTNDSMLDFFSARSTDL